MIRIVIGEDHAIVRAGLRQTLLLEADVEIVGEASDGPSLVDLVEARRPDVVLTDLSMPGLSCLDLIKALRQAGPSLPILVLSMHDQVEIVARVLRAGATGYLSKNADPEVLVDALRRTAGGERFVSPELAQRMVLERASAPGESESISLTDREYEVLVAIARGTSPANLAQTLGLSPKTVSAHKIRLMRKVGATSTAQLVRYALDRRIIE